MSAIAESSTKKQLIYTHSQRFVLGSFVFFKVEPNQLQRHAPQLLLRFDIASLQRERGE
jgi:hypothetical protein